jgi:hypothetical protein
VLAKKTEIRTQKSVRPSTVTVKAKEYCGERRAIRCRAEEAESNQDRRAAAASMVVVLVLIIQPVVN